VYCQVTVATIEEERYYEFNNALPDSVLIGVVDLLFSDDDIAESQIFVEVSRPVSFGIMDRLLGGSGDGVDYDREYTDIEFSLLDNLFRQFVPLIRDSWSNHYDLKVTYNHLETNSRLIQSIRPDEIVVIIVMDIALKSLKGSVSVCIPAVTLENLFKKATKNLKTRRSDALGEEIRKELVLNYIKDSNLEIKAVLGDTEVTLRDVMDMQVGDVVMLKKPVDSDIAIKVGNSTWFYGKAGYHKNKKAVKVTTVI
jgi:flagellar motor switch protein FliM